MKRLLLTQDSGQSLSDAGAEQGIDGRGIEWLHIPKAGTSFGNLLLLWACPELEPRLWYTTGVDARQLPPACVRRFRHEPAARLDNFIGDHISLTNRTVAELGRVYTILRSPRMRLASGFHMIFTKEPNATAERVCVATEGSTRIHVAHGVQVRMVLGEPLEYRGTLRGVRGGHHFLSPAEPSAEQAEAACARLRQFAFVGITDFWAASVCLFHAQHGGEAHPVELENVRKGGYSQLAHSVKDADCGDTADERLFACGMDLFLSRLEAHPHCLAHMRTQTFGSAELDARLEAWYAQHGVEAAA